MLSSSGRTRRTKLYIPKASFLWFRKNATSSFDNAQKAEIEDVHVFVQDAPVHSNGCYRVSDHHQHKENSDKNRLQYPPYEAGDLVQVKCDHGFAWRDAWVEERVGDGVITSKGRTETYPQYRVKYSQPDKLEPVAESTEIIVVPAYDMRQEFWRDIILEMGNKDPAVPQNISYQEEDDCFQRAISLYDAYEKMKPKVKKKTRKKRKKSVAENPQKSAGGKNASKKPEKKKVKKSKSKSSPKKPDQFKHVRSNRASKCWIRTVGPGGTGAWSKSPAYEHFLDKVSAGVVRLPFNVLPTKYFKRTAGLKIYHSTNGKLGPNGMQYVRNLRAGLEHLDISYAGYKHISVKDVAEIQNSYWLTGVEDNPADLTQQTDVKDNTDVKDKTAVAESDTPVSSCNPADACVVAAKTVVAENPVGAAKTVVAENPVVAVVAENPPPRPFALENGNSPAPPPRAPPASPAPRGGRRAPAVTTGQSQWATHKFVQALRNELLLRDYSVAWKIAIKVGAVLDHFFETIAVTKQEKLVAKIRIRKSHQKKYPRLEVYIPSKVVDLMEPEFRHKKCMYFNTRGIKVDESFAGFVQEKLDKDYNPLPLHRKAAMLSDGFVQMKDNSETTHPIAKDIIDAWVAYNAHDLEKCEKS